MSNANIIKVKSQNFHQEVEKSDVPVLVDFWAPWCGPCLAMAPILEQLAKKYDGKIKIGKANVDEDSTLASKFQIMSIPTLILFKDGLAVNQIVGLRSAQALEGIIEKAM